MSSNFLLCSILIKPLIWGFFIIKNSPCPIFNNHLALLLMKGENILYNNVVPSSLEELDDGAKGQRNTYLDKRSDAMACRFYYHATICRLRYDDTLLNLSMEFFLEPDTIVGWLKQRSAFLNNLAHKQITTSVLRRRYPHFDWSSRPTNIKVTPAGNLSLF